MIPEEVLAHKREPQDEDEVVEIYELGRSPEGEVLRSNRRLYMQLHAFGDCTDVAPLIAALDAAQLPGTLYLDINDPRGVGLLTYSEDPEFFLTTLRTFLLTEPFVSLTPKPEFTMMGRTYSIGYESDL
ncbi:MAG: hypothetical protein KDD83_09375, partial [Caldilineaceae bacterium]|nr:hypothetical protein [Caldilineaceae bacterium]